MMNVTCNFVYFLLGVYVKYLPGSIFTNSMVISVAESLSYITSGYICSKLTIKKGVSASFVAAGIACALVMFCELH